MYLEKGCGNLGIDAVAEQMGDSLVLVLTACKKKDLLCLHDRAEAHGDRLLRNVVDGSEESGVCLNGILGEIRQVSFVVEGVAGLVEADGTLFLLEDIIYSKPDCHKLFFCQHSINVEFSVSIR